MSKIRVERSFFGEIIHVIAMLAEKGEQEALRLMLWFEHDLMGKPKRKRRRSRRGASS